MYELKKYRYRVFGSKGRFEESVKTVLVGPEGRKKLPVLMVDGSLTVKMVPLEERRFMSDVEIAGRKTLKGVVRQYRGIGNRLGMTKAAKSFLTKAIRAV